MENRKSRTLACQSLFDGFVPDFSSSRHPERNKRIVHLASQGYFSHEIAEQLGISAKAVQKVYRRYNFPFLQNFAPPLLDQRTGWKGGIKEAKGYLYSRTPGHPNASKHGKYVAVHRLAMENKLCRYLLQTEVVHHLDGNPKNNDPNNLGLYQSNADHLRETLKGQCPKWSEDGKVALDVARRRPRRTLKVRSIEPNLVE